MGRGLGWFFVWLLLAATVPVGSVAAALPPGDPGHVDGDMHWHDSFTVFSTWSPNAGNDSEGAMWLTLAAMKGTADAARDGAGTPFVSLQWVHDTAGFFPTKRLQLKVAAAGLAASAGDVTWQTVNLLQVSAHEAKPYTAYVSYDAETALLHVAVFEGDDPGVWQRPTADAGGMPYAVLHFGTTLPVAVYDGVLKADFAGQPIVVTAGSLEATVEGNRGFRPVAQRLEFGEINELGALMPLRILGHDAQPGLRLRSTVPVPGEYRVWVHEATVGAEIGEQGTAYRGSDARLLVPIAEAAGTDGITLFAPGDLPLGRVVLDADYVIDGHVLLSRRFPVTVGKAELDIRLTEVDAAGNIVHGVVALRHVAPLPGASVRLTGRLTRLDWNDSTRVYDEVTHFDEVLLLDTAFDALGTTGELPFAFAVPGDSGLWRLNVKAQSQPAVQLYVTGTEEMWSMDTSDDDVYVAVTDQASRKILVLDPAVADWDLSAAVRWSWSPGLHNGFAGLTHGWANPSGLKLRESELWGGLWMVVVDSRGLAAIVPYPAGDSRKWGQVISGNLHSAELLPDGNIAIAASTGGFVRIYTSSQGPDSAVYTEYPLVGAHGVLWDPQGDVLWALGDHHLVALKVGGTPAAPTLTAVHEKALPSVGGHDLAPVYGNTDRLWVTTVHRVYQYEKSTDTWHTTYPGGDATGITNVKGVGNLPDGRLVYSQQKAGTLHSWTTDTVNFLLPQFSRIRSGAAFYKARVWYPAYQ